MMTRRTWLALASLVLSVVMVVVVVRELAELDWAAIAGMVPASPLFWLVFAGAWISVPLGDWFAFRRFWPMDAHGLAALSRKQVYNELVLGYLGEVYFYTWAKRHLSDAPFGPVKDVAILSGLAGNLFTIILLLLVWPQMGPAMLESGRGAIGWSLALVVGLSVIVLLARRRVFVLDRADQWAIFAIHLVRNAVRAGLGALMWYLLLPEVGLSWWLYLVTLRQLVTRLPMVSNKEVLFAGMAVLLLGDQPEIAAVMALTAALLVIANVVVGLVLLRGDLGEIGRLLRRRRVAK